jgi:hypothetical protein
MNDIALIAILSFVKERMMEDGRHATFTPGI